MSASRRRLLVVSNRGPVSYRIGDGGHLVARRGGGGLVTALGGLAPHHDVTWISCAMSEGDVRAAEEAPGGIEEIARGGASYTLKMVGAPDEIFRLHYTEFANPLLWFLHHRLWGFATAPVIDRRMHRAYAAYRTVNQRVADAVIAEALAYPTDAILIQDYHLYLVPGLVRAALPDATIQFFLHIPWPDPGAWRCLPVEWTRDFLGSVAASDLVGLQTSPDADAFRRSCKDLLGLEVDTAANLVRSGDHVAHVRHYPISLAVDEFEELARSSGVARVHASVQDARPDAVEGQLIVRVDRTDPSKNIVRGMRAFGLMLHEHPELHGKVSMYCQLDPSRQDIQEYVSYKDEIVAAADEVNFTFGNGSWRPVVLNLDASFHAAVAAYKEYDVLFVNPVADGMNLVSKEGPLVNERGGVLVLSEQAGSFRELGEHAIAVNPFDIAEQADALYEALHLPQAERLARAESLREQVVEHDVRKWMNDQLRDLFVMRDSRISGGPLP